MNDKMARLWATKTRDDEWWSSFVTAPAAILVNYVVVDIAWLTPNLLTLISLVTALVAALFIVLGGTAYFLLAAALIQLSHVLDCMDGQMARYREATSPSGSYFDRTTDQIQVAVWFGAVGYAAYDQSGRILPIFLAFTGVAFYSLRGYAKYVEIQIEMARDPGYLDKIAADQLQPVAGSFTWPAAIRWFARQQPKIRHFDEGVFIFMLSLALVLDRLVVLLWVFAVSQAVIGLSRTWQRGRNIERGQQKHLQK